MYPLTFNDARDLAFDHGLLNVLENRGSGNVSIVRHITTGQQVMVTPIVGDGSGVPSADPHKITAITMNNMGTVFALTNPKVVTIGVTTHRPWLIAQHTYDQ